MMKHLLIIIDENEVLSSLTQLRYVMFSLLFSLFYYIFLLDDIAIFLCMLHLNYYLGLFISEDSIKPF